MLHGDEFWQEFLALRVAAEAVDHPGRHVVDRHIGGGRRAAPGELLIDDDGVEIVERRAAHVRAHVEAAEAERRRLAQGLGWKDLVLVPRPRMRHHLGLRELPRGVLERALLVVEGKFHRKSSRSKMPLIIAKARAVLALSSQFRECPEQAVILAYCGGRGFQA